MRNTVILEQLSRGELRPREQYQEYGQLLSRDAQAILNDPSAVWLDRPCPGCGGQAAREFAKEGFEYRLCPACHTLFASPVPDQKALDELSRQGQAAAFRRELFTSYLSNQRQQHVLGPWLTWMTDILDLNGAYPRVYCECLCEDPNLALLVRQSGLFGQVRVLPASGAGELVKEQGLDILDSWEEMQGADVITLFGVLDKVSDPRGVLARAAAALTPGGYLFLTTTTSSGIEYLVLGENAPNLLPLDRLTLFSVEAIERNLTSMGLTMLELSTPGRLDVELLQEYVREHPEKKNIARFWRYVFSRTDPEATRDLQLFLQEHRLSSFLRAAARKTA